MLDAASPYHPTDLEAYFAPCGSAMIAYSEKKGLLVEKYYHDYPLWSLCFGHPKGGQAKIDVFASSYEHLVVQPVWWVDDYSTFTRSLIWGAKKICGRTPGEVEEAIDAAFHQALGWDPGAWSQVAEGYEPYWSTFSEEAFVRLANPWPLPRTAESV